MRMPGKWLPLGLFWICLAGCGPRESDRKLDATEERLLTIGTAYVNATNRLGRAPKNFDEIKPDIEGEIPKNFLISPNDQRKLVIIWGVDYNSLPPKKGNPFTVAAYEKYGVDGRRYVLRFPKSVVIVSDEDFSKAVFPKGHKPEL